MKFTYKSAAQIAEMTEYQQEKYFDEKRTHEANEMARVSKEAAETAVAEVKLAAETAIAEQKAAFETALAEQKAAFELQLKTRDEQVEAAIAEMNRIKANERGATLKTLQGEIFEYFSTKDGEAMLENFTQNKGKLHAELTNINVKAVGVMGVTAGTVNPQFVSYVGIEHEVVQARNIIPVSPTSSDLVKYVQFTKKEGSIGSVDAGTEKPQIDYNSTPVSAPVIKIAGWLTVQDEFLEDVVGARDFLAEELPKAYMDEETRQIFKGLGTAATPDELDGLMSVWAQDLVLPKGSGPNQVTEGSNNWDKLAAGLCQVRRNLRATDAIFLSPEDYMELLINKGNTLEYTYPITSTIGGTLLLGGVPIYQHGIFNPGEGITGDFRRGARIFQKKAMTIRTSTEHDKNFTFNLTTILIEARIALACFFPESFVKFDFNTTS